LSSGEKQTKGAMRMYENKVVEVEQLIEGQNRWRDTCITLIASENVVSQRARAQAGSDFAHR
jgi:glycine/serine hydroxymethyltransferase